MTSMSYAQNGEDVVLARAFPPTYVGFYIDVGASDPVVDSVTKYFYDRGWHGVNIEPATVALEDLRSTRKRDINLGVALGESDGVATFYELPHQMTGCSTLSPELAEQYRDEGWEIEEREVGITPLASVCEEHAGERTIDFLKIDVEGDEATVLAGADFERFRPRILIVEATRPGTPIPIYKDWEPLIINARYEFVLFDGLNRFYVREEDHALADILAVPANYFDDYLPRKYAIWRQAAEQNQQAVELARQATTEVENAQHQLQEAYASENAAKGAATAQETRAQSAEISLEQTRQQLAASRAALRDARTELKATRSALAAINDQA